MRAPNQKSNRRGHTTPGEGSNGRTYNLRRSHGSPHRPSAANPGPMATRRPGGGHLGLHHLRHRRHRRPPLPLRLAPQPHHRRRAIRRHPGPPGRTRHPARCLHHELCRRPLWAPPGDPAGHLPRRAMHLALRLRHRFRLDGRAVRPQHPRRRRHRGDPLGLPVRDDPRPTCATGCC
jgi:hypothetical protein